MNLIRQQRRALERAKIRTTMSKKERRDYQRLETPLKREVYKATLELLADGVNPRNMSFNNKK